MSAARADILAGLRASADTTIGDASPEELLDRYRAEFEAYPGELAMLRGLVGVLRVVAKHGDMAEVQRLLAEHIRDEQAAYSEEKATPTTGASVTPQLDDRLGRLADHILSHGGEWTTGKAHRWLVAEVDPGVSRHRARYALQDLAAAGYLTEHDRSGRRTYTPNYPKGER
jgi:hypothetical protein